MSLRSLVLHCCVVLLAGLPIQCLVLDGESTDVEIQQLLLHLEAEVNGLKSEVASLKSRLANETLISNNGPVPAFLATLDTTVSNCNSRPVIFDNVHLNEGSYYDVRHGLFRAPQNGTYHFAVTLSNPASKSYHVYLVLNTYTNVIGYLHLESTNGWTERSTNVLVKLQKGDDVWLECFHTGESSIQGGGFHSHFSGFYIGK